jgi:hypothetical protein
VKELQDSDPMPIGRKYRDVPMGEVPVWHLHWWWNEGKRHEVKTCPVADYISRNMGALMKENPDLIWEKEEAR